MLVALLATVVIAGQSHSPRAQSLPKVVNNDPIELTGVQSLEILDTDYTIKNNITLRGDSNFNGRSGEETGQVVASENADTPIVSQ
jgi:hypothetical protein